MAIHHRLVEERVHFVRVQSKLSSDSFNNKVFKRNSSSVYLSLCEFLFADDAALVALSNDVLQKIFNIDALQKILRYCPRYVNRFL